jgi:hypothetical protein
MPSEPDLPLIEGYLGVLRVELGNQPDVERFVAEARGHLIEATLRARTDGLSCEDAQRLALARFGSAQIVAAASRGIPDEPLVCDVRGGLSFQAIEMLLQATRLGLMQRDGRTAAVGVWVDNRFVGALLVRRRDARNDLATTTPIPIRMLEANASRAWLHLIRPALHVGMLVHAEVWSGQPRLWFGPIFDRASQPNQLALTFPRPVDGASRPRAFLR